jgi:predicted acetyltransferase
MARSRRVTSGRVKVFPAAAKQRQVLWRLMQLYLHDFSEIDGRALNDRGEFEYRYFENYWVDRDRVALLAQVDGAWAGFALIRLGTTNQVAEFFVARGYRRAGVGRRLAAECFRRFPGGWRVRQAKKNGSATKFWRAVIPAPFKEATNARGTTQHFRIAMGDRI